MHITCKVKLNETGSRRIGVAIITPSFIYTDTEATTLGHTTHWTMHGFHTDFYYTHAEFLSKILECERKRVKLLIREVVKLNRKYKE